MSACRPDAPIWLLTERTGSYVYPVQDLTRESDLALESLGQLEKTVKAARVAVSDIQLAGERIYTHLGNEAQLLSARQKILAQQADKADVDKAVQVSRIASPRQPMIDLMMLKQLTDFWMVIWYSSQPYQ